MELLKPTLVLSKQHMPTKFPINKGRLFSFVVYAILVAIIKTWSDHYEISVGFVVAIGFVILLVGALGEYNPFLLAFIYTHRRGISILVLIICLIFARYLYQQYPCPDTAFFKEPLPKWMYPISEILIQGMLIGVLGRIMLLNLFASIIRVTNIQNAKTFVLLSFLVFLLLFPVSLNHRWLAYIYVIGCGVGFFLHYMMRPREKKKQVYRKFKARILRAAEKEREAGKKLTANEEYALNLFVNRKWKKLESFVSTIASTDKLYFMRLSALHASREYERALSKLRDIKQSSDLTHFHYLHTALNESERFDHNKDVINPDIIKESLEEAHNRNANCMMTNANLALHLVYQNGGEKAQEKALKLTRKAIKEYENNKEDSLISLITGMGVPVTYAYLLDIYAYVLLKSGRTRFARHFLFQCLYLDPNHASTYLHLAEYYYILCQKPEYEIKYRHWSKTAKMCLYIAKMLEQKKKKIRGGSLIYNKAESLLISLENNR